METAEPNLTDAGPSTNVGGGRSPHDELFRPSLKPATTAGFLYLDEKTVQTVCCELDPIAIIKEVFELHGSGSTTLPDEAYLAWNTANDTLRSLNMPGFLAGSVSAAGTKIINSNPRNVARGLPRASGITLLFDLETAAIQCIMEGATVSALRTASVSVLSIERLARNSPARLSLIGAGRIGKAHLELAARTFPSLECVTIFDTDSSAAQRLAESTAKHAPSIRVQTASSAQDAVRASDVLITATTTVTGYIGKDWISPGTTIINVSLDDLLPDVYLSADLVFVDDWRLVSSDRRRLLGRMYHSGLVSSPKEDSREGMRRIDGDIGDLVLGRHPGRRSETDVIVVNPFGLAIEDVAFASRIFEIARARGLGQQLQR